MRLAHPSVDLALREVTDATAFERASFYVLRQDYPSLELTAPTADGGKDLKVAPLGSAREDVRVMVSLQKSWHLKLDQELRKIRALPRSERPSTALFVTNQAASDAAVKTRQKAARRLGVDLAVTGRTHLAARLEDPSLRWVAEVELDVEPVRPRSLLSAAAFCDAAARLTPGFDAELVGREDTIEELRRLLQVQEERAARIIVLEGVGGVGKTRLAVHTASEGFVTAVLPAGVRLPASEVRDVPPGVPAVIVVDDAHRAADLSGIRTLLADPRFEDTKIVLTSRPGLTERALAESGLSDFTAERIEVGLLPRDAMASLVEGWGITDDRFATAVIEVARGVPLLAHAMCETALERGKFDATDMVEVLDSRLVSRLEAHGVSARAVGVALSLGSEATISTDGHEQSSPGSGVESVARFASAVSSMPDPGDVAQTLELLADVGLAQVTLSEPVPGDRTFTYSIKPDLLGVSLVASALGAERGARIQLSELLVLVGFPRRGAGAAGAAGGAGGTNGSYGGQTVLGRLDSTLARHQVNLLAEAAAIADRSDIAQRLAAEIIRLVPDDPTIRDLRVVVDLASAVVGTVPALVSELHSVLSRHWPPKGTGEHSLWLDSPTSVDEYEYKALGNAVFNIVQRHGARSTKAATRLGLSAAVLFEPWIGRPAGQAGRDSLLSRAIRAVVLPRPHESVATSLERRSAVIGEVQAWVDAQLASAAAELGAAGPASGSARDSVLTAAASALVETLNPVVELGAVGSPASADVFVMSAGRLPVTAEVIEVLGRAGAALAGLVAHLELVDDDEPEADARAVARAFIDVPHELWAIGRRGLPRGSGPLPRRLAKALTDQGRAVEEAFAARWDDMPLWARYEITRSVDSVRPARSLARRARDGSPVAAAALGDHDLGDLMVVAPLRRPTSEELKAPSARSRTRRRAQVRQVLISGGTSHALSLLRTAQVLNRSWQDVDPCVELIDDLADAVTTSAEALEVLEDLMSGPPAVAGGRLVARLLNAHGDVIAARVREMAQSVPDFLLLLDVIPSVADGELRRELTQTCAALLISWEARRSEVEDSTYREVSSRLEAAAQPVGGEGPSRRRRQPTVSLPGVSTSFRALRAAAHAVGAAVPQPLSDAASTPVRQAAAVGSKAVNAARVLGRHVPLAGGSSGARGDAVAGPSAAGRPGEESMRAGLPSRAELDDFARQWVLMTWRLPADEDDAQGAAVPAAGWRIDALIDVGLHGPLSATGEVLKRATYQARRQRRRRPGVAARPEGPERPKDNEDDQDNQQVLTDGQVHGLVKVLSRALVLDSALDWSSFLTDWEWGEAASELAGLAPEDVAQTLAGWLLRPDGTARRWPLEWEDPLRAMGLDDRVAFGLALQSRLEEAFEAVEFDSTRQREIARFEIDRVLSPLLRDSAQWRDLVTRWIDDPETQVRAAQALAGMWRVEDWPPLVVRLLATSPTEEVVRLLIGGMMPTGVGPDLGERIKPRLAALEKVAAVGDEQVEQFVARATEALQELVADYRREAARRRQGY
jgi:hypothetical protein